VTRFPTPLPLGRQRDWIWRGWRIRYAFLRAQLASDTSAPVLFLHGFGSSLSQWQRNLSPLSQTHTTYALDLLGFGASEKASTAYNVALWAEQTYEFWKTFINRPMVLVGHSLGAVVALAAAVNHPEMLDGLVLLTLPPARQELLSGKTQAIALWVEGLFASPLLLRPIFLLVRRPQILRAALRMAYVDPGYVTDELISDFIKPTFERGAGTVFNRLAKARTQTSYTPEIRTLLPQLQKPILLLWGEGDRVVPLNQGKHFPELNPQVELVTLPNAGHCLYDECADRVNAEILRWIDHVRPSQEYQEGQ
jgi:pimeloyl-ACP methyl ester carboxylesterase